MKSYALLIACFCLFSCSSQKNVPAQGHGAGADSVTVATSNSNETKTNTPTKTIILNNPETTDQKAGTPAKKDADHKKESMPECLKMMVKKFMEEDVQNPPRKIYSYVYKGKLVYYVTPPCCDFFSDLYDAQCKLIAHPDGGITGKGDGRARDFAENKTQEKLVWEDSRKYR